MLYYLLAIAIVTLVYSLLALGLTLQFGRVGLVNFGLVGFFAIGAYTSALLSMAGVPLLISIPVAGLVAAALAWPIGLISLRLGEDYFAIVTLGFSETVRYVIVSEAWLTNGVQGIPGIVGLYPGLPGLARPIAALATLAAVAALAAWCLHRISASPFGRVIEAIRDNETAVKALGKSPTLFKTQVFAIGSALAGVAGAVYAHYIGYVVPDQFIPLLTFYIWMAVIMGGAGRVSGALVGSLLLSLFLEGSRFIRDVLPGIAEVEMASIRLGIIGVALILFTIYMPRGIMGDYSKR